MCKAWDDRKEEGRQEGILVSIQQLMKKLTLSASEAMDILDIVDREKYLELLN